MPATATRNQGKSMFVKEVLDDNPLANAEAVNEAWREAGMAGGISTSLVSNVRSRMGLTGNLGRGRRRRMKITGVGRGRRLVQLDAGANGTTTVMTRGRKSDLMDLEVEIDQLLMRVVEIGMLPDVESALRTARRHLYSTRAWSPGPEPISRTGSPP
jgi:hypothetical protein